MRGKRKRMFDIGKFLLMLGIAIALLGAVIILFRNAGIPFLGKLPGDIIVQRKNFTFYFPIVTCIVLSIILSIILYFVSGKK
jgi:hypothetical protein